MLSILVLFKNSLADLEKQATTPASQAEAGTSYHGNSARPTIFRGRVAREGKRLCCVLRHHYALAGFLRAILEGPGRAPVAHARDYYYFFPFPLCYIARRLQDCKY